MDLCPRRLNGDRGGPGKHARHGKRAWAIRVEARQTDEVMWISRREVARPGPRAGAPLGPSRTLPTLKRVASSPTGGPRSGILDKRFGQKAEHDTTKSAFPLPCLQQTQLLLVAHDFQVICAGRAEKLPG